MNHEERRTIAVWRYGIIAPALSGTHDYPTDNAFFRAIAKKTYIHPITHEEKRYCPGTFRAWISSYRKYGIDGLISRRRTDAGISRKLSEEAKQAMIDLREQFPSITNTMIRTRLIQKGLIKSTISQSTIDRHMRSLKAGGKLEEIHRGKERKAYEWQYANQCWQADTTHLYQFQGRKTYLISIIDDASRFSIGNEIFYEDNGVNFQKVLRDAIATYGRPRVLYVDNGAAYDNQQLQLICARLGIELVHTPLRDGAAKGKVEVSFKSHKNHWLRCEDWSQFHSLEELNSSFQRYLESDYINRPHRALKDEDGQLMTPRQRFIRDAQRFEFIAAEELDEAFLHTYERKVRTDSTIQLFNEYYEVPFQYMRETVQVYVDPQDKQLVWIVPEGEKERIPVKKVDKVSNSRIRRKQHIDFGKGER